MRLEPTTWWRIPSLGFAFTLVAALVSLTAGSVVGCKDAGGGDTGDDGAVPEDAQVEDDSGNVGETVEFDPAFETIPISVTEPAGAERVLAPVSGGIPLGRGVLQPSQVDRLVLADGSGYRVTSFGEPTVLSAWSDGSVKWLLLDFLATMPTGGSVTYTLGPADVDTTMDVVVTVAQDAETFTVDTQTAPESLNSMALVSCPFPNPPPLSCWSWEP